MSMYDTTTGTYSDLAYGLDSDSQNSGGPSIFSSVGNILTKGVPLTALSIVNSFANTGIKLANVFGADVTPINPSQQAEDYLGSDYKDYYDEHSTAIEFSGLAVGSFVPGLAAVKALKAAQSLGKTNILIGRSIGYFSGERDAIVAKAAIEVAAGNAAIFPGLTAMKYKAIGMGLGDQVLQALAWETATTATMKASPILNDLDLQDTLLNIGMGALVGGAVGGAIEGLLLRKSFSKLSDAAAKATNTQEGVTNYGGSNAMVLGGDRVAAAAAYMDAVPPATNLLGRTRNTAATVLATDNMKSALQAIGPTGDPVVANAMVDALVRMRQSAGDFGTAVVDLAARLGKISRFTGDEVTDISGSLPTGESFFINRFFRSNSYKPNFDNDLISTMPHADADLSRQYRINIPGDRPRVARATEYLETPDGTFVAKYNNPTEAFHAGEDIFIDLKNRVFVNSESRTITAIPQESESTILNARQEIAFRRDGVSPQPRPGSEPYKPVTSAPLALNVITGDLATASSIVPTVGDLGTASVIDAGLLVGKKLFPHTLNTLITDTTSTIEANARYVWAGMRGLKSGDSISSADIPMLEALRNARNKYLSETGKTADDFAAEMTRRGISLVDNETGEGFSLAGSGAGLDRLIVNTKRQFLADAMVADSKLSATQLSRLANVPEDFIASNFSARSFADATIPWEQSASINHVKMEYNLENFTRLPDGTIMQGMLDLQHRIGLIKDAAQTAVARFVGPEADAWFIKAKSTDIIPERSGATFFGASNADYNSIPQQFERLGRTVASFVKSRLIPQTEQLHNPLQILRGDPAAMQELQNFIFIRQSTAESYQFIPEALRQAYRLPEDTVVLGKSLVRDKAGNIIEWDKGYTPKGFFPAAALGDQAGEIEHSAFHTYYTLSPKVAEYERVAMEINNNRISHANNFFIANGLPPRLMKDTLYAPAIDTTRYPFFAQVRSISGQGFSDNSVSIIVAKSADELAAKIALIDRDQFQVYTKAEIKRYHELQGDYDYDRNFSQTAINSELQRKGILNDLVPQTNPDVTVQNILDFHSKQETRLARDYAELGNAQLFAEMKDMGAQYTNIETSRVGYVPTLLGKTAENPYDDLIKNALAISPKENYRLWQDSQEKLEAFASSAFNAAKTGFGLAAKNILPFEDAMKLANKMGLGNVYSAAIDAAGGYTNFAFKLPPQNILSKFVATANSVMGATAIRLDFFQSMINVISTPVLMLAEAHSANKAIQELMSTAVPGANFRAPSATKLMFQAVASFVRNDADRVEVTGLLKGIGAIKDDISDYYKMLDSMTLPLGKISDSAWAKKLSDMVDLGAKYTGSNVAEELSRFIPGFYAVKIFRAAGYEGQQLLDNVSTFVTRVQGNYVSHQRPVAFQGPLGQAVGLFQTYQFNLLQQMFRYIENGEAKSLATLAGVQTTLFGINGLPGFQAINQHLVANAPGNFSHSDAFSNLTSPGITSNNPLNRDVGDYLLYGALSNVLSTGLYSRGDISPRNISVLPINPLDYPAISGGIKLLSAIGSIGQSVANGGSLPSSMLLGLEHNGLSRPLTGLAQIAQGFVTTGKGGIVAITRPGMDDNTMGWSELQSIGNFSRLLGARPLDEAVVMDAMYRRGSYQAADMTRLEKLGEAFKSSIHGSEPDASQVENFTAKYTAAGGNIVNYGKFILNATSQANASVANDVYTKMRTPAIQNMINSMGGVMLPDYRNQGVRTPQQVSTAPRGTGLQTPNTAAYVP